MKITHDFHIHTALSLCANKSATVEAYAATAKKLGLKKMGFSDHFWDDTYENAYAFFEKQVSQHDPARFYIPQNFEHLALIKPELEKVDFGETQIFFGCETDYDPVNRRPAISVETAEKFDFILMPNSHTHMMMPLPLYHPYEKHIEYMTQIYEDTLNSDVAGYITAMAHPFEAVCCLYDYNILVNMIPDDDLKRLFDKTANKGIAVEINVSSMGEKTAEQIENCAQMRLFRLARECGCKFIFGSDSHRDTGHATYSNATLVAELLDLKEDDIAEIAR